VWVEVKTSRPLVCVLACNWKHHSRYILMTNKNVSYIKLIHNVALFIIMQCNPCYWRGRCPSIMSSKLALLSQKQNISEKPGAWLKW
jgi:hypothetical protein